MKEKLTYGAYILISLNFFSIFSEYFITAVFFGLLITITLIAYNVSGLLIQKAICDCLILVLSMSCYLIFNEDFTCLETFTGMKTYMPIDLTLINFESFNHSIKNDFLAFFYKFLICSFSAIYFLAVLDTLREQKLIAFEYQSVVLLALIGFMLMCNGNELLIVYLTVELGSLASYILASFRKASSYSVESGVKYFVTGAVSSSFFLIGSSILYGVTGSIQFLNFDAFYMNLLLFDVSDNLVDSFPEVGLTFILFSIFIKLSVAPFHLWSLDVYEGSPTNSTIFFAVISKLSLFVLIIRFCYGSLKEFADCWEFYTVAIGVLSIFVGSFGGLKQRKLKTLIAYSSTSHIGYCLLALVANYIGLTSLFFYMTVYMISGLSIWSILLALRLKENFSSNKYNKELGSLSLLRKSNSPLTFVLVLTIFSLAGTPPLLGFLAKIFLFLPVVGFTYYSVVLISLLISVVSTFYYIRVVKVLYFENVLIGELYHSISGLKIVTLSFLAFLLIFFFLNPMLLYLINYKSIFEFQFCL